MSLGLSCTKIANAVRSDLAATYPGVRFSVVPVAPTPNIATITVKWKDGPTEAQVTDLTRKYLAGPDAKPITLTTARGHTITGTSHVTAFNLNRTTTPGGADHEPTPKQATTRTNTSWIDRLTGQARRALNLREARNLPAA